MGHADNLIADVARRRFMKKLRISQFLRARVQESQRQKKPLRQEHPALKRRNRPRNRCRRSIGWKRTGSYIRDRGRLTGFH